MDILKKKAAVPGLADRSAISTSTTKKRGDAAEDDALDFLQNAGLRVVTRNYRTAGRGGGEIDLIMRERDGTVVFVEVRSRRASTHGGAAGSVTFAKQRRIIFAAQCWLARAATLPPCRFDVVSVEAGRIEWLKAAFNAG